MSATKITSRNEIAVWTAAQAADIQLALLYNAAATEAWAYNAASTDATSDGFVIVPADAPASGRWIRQSDYVATALALDDVAKAPAKAVNPGTIGYDELSPDVVQELAQATENVSSIHQQLLASLQHVIDVAASAGANIQSLKRSLTVQTGALQADYQERITVVTTNLEALAQLYEGVSASLAGKVDTSAFLVLQSSVSTIAGEVDATSLALLSVQTTLGNKVDTSAFSTLQTTVTEQGTLISAQSTSLTGIYTRVDNIWAQGLIRMSAAVTPDGFDSYVQISAAGSAGGPTVPAGMFIGVKTVDGVPLAYIDYIADRVRWLSSTGDRLALLTSAGFLVNDRLLTGSLSTGTVYALSDGYTTKTAEDTTAEPPDGSEVSISNGTSVSYYDSRVLASDGVAGYKTDPTSSLVEVEARFVFRVQTGAGAAAKAGIEYYNGSSWAFVPDSDDVIYTSNTNALASLMSKAPLPSGTTYWRPRIWNTTGNTIWMRRFRAYETKLVK